MASPRYEVVFFDFGGTLAWAEPRADSIWVQALGEHGYRVTSEEIIETSGTPGPEINRSDIIRAFNETRGASHPSFPSPEEEEPFFRRYDAALLRRLGLPRDDAILDTVGRLFKGVVNHLYDDVQSTLTQLQGNGFRLGLISNAPHDLPRRMEELDLARHFETLTYSYAVGAEKPDPRIFQTALTAMNVQPEEAVHVGDNVEADVRGASEVGIIPILIDRKGRHRKGDFIIIRDLGEVLAHVGADGRRKDS